MAPPANREIEITYGSLILGGTGSGVAWGQIHRVHLIDKSYPACRAVFEVLVTGSSAADFATNCSTLETAFRTPRQRLTVKFGASTFLDLDPSAKTGFEQQPTCEKTTEAASARSRVYRCSVTAQLPADADSGRLRIGITLAYDAARRRQVTITGHYTAISGATARAQYGSTADAYCSSVLSSVASGGTFQLLREDAGPSDIANSNLEFVRVYEEVIYGATSSTLAHSSIRGHRINYTRSIPAPGDTPGKSARRLENATATFEGWVDKTVTTSLRTLWNSVKSWMLEEIESKFQPASVAIVDETYNLDQTTNRLTGTLTLKMAGSGTFTVEYERVVEFHDQLGKVLVPVWGEKAYEKHVFQGPARAVKTTTENEVSLGSGMPGESSLDDNPLDQEDAPDGASWVLIDRLRRARKIVWGRDGDRRIFAVVSTIITTQEAVIKPKATKPPVTTPPSSDKPPSSGKKEKVTTPGSGAGHVDGGTNLNRGAPKVGGPGVGAAYTA